MNFRSLTIADLPAAMKLELSIKHSLDWFPGDIKRQKQLIEHDLNFGVFNNVILIGKVGFWSPRTNEYEVDGMIITEEFRGEGIGGLLFDYALKELIKKAHPNKLFLFTHPKNTPAMSIYQQFGFVKKKLFQTNTALACTGFGWKR